MPEISLKLIVIRCKDLDRARLFYETIGLSFVRHRHGNGPEHLSAEMGSLVFEIYPCVSDENATTAVRLGFQVASVNEMVLKLQTIGATVVSQPKDSEWGRRAIVDDFDGHRVELTS